MISPVCSNLDERWASQQLQLKLENSEVVIRNASCLDIDTFTIMFWNGGGCMLSRLSVNPELKEIFSAKPNMFVYVQSLVFRVVEKKLPGYSALHHFAKPNSCRRGITVYLQEKFQFCISKDSACDSFDILWIRLQSSSEAFIFCFSMPPETINLLAKELNFKTK